MGKKSKLFKSGLPRNQIKKLSNIKKEIARLPINNIPEVKKSSENTKKDVQMKFQKLKLNMIPY